METKSRTGGEHALAPYRDEIVAAIDAGVSAERIGGLLSERLRRKISKDSVWRFGLANGARRKRHRALRSARFVGAARRLVHREVMALGAECIRWPCRCGSTSGSRTSTAGRRCCPTNGRNRTDAYRVRSRVPRSPKPRRSALLCSSPYLGPPAFGRPDFVLPTGVPTMSRTTTHRGCAALQSSCVFRELIRL